MKQAMRSVTPVVMVALLGGCGAMGKVGDFGRNIVEVMSGNTARKAVLEMEDQDFADERRVGINYLANHKYGRQEPYTQRYEQIAQSDPDWLVRATAVRALNRSRDKAATPVFIRALDDQSEQVRLEGAKALVNVPDEKAVPALVRVVSNANENRDVRIASAEALRHYHTIEVARTLIAQLGVREFGLAWQSRQSLKKLTGQD
ncbi:MAG: HEAT repeat domain-containing protein, partial [Tepidisphaeraceae bacterium]